MNPDTPTMESLHGLHFTITKSEVVPVAEMPVSEPVKVVVFHNPNIFLIFLLNMKPIETAGDTYHKGWLRR